MSEEKGFAVDYNKIDSKVTATVKAIEGKPHVRYIRYMLTKMYSPVVIKKELFSLGLSAPHEPNLVAYYLAVLDPIIRKHKLSEAYSLYKSKLLRKNAVHAFSKDLLNYKLMFIDDLDGQANFCKFIKEIEVDSLWMNEVVRAHGGSPMKLPVDEKTGERILNYSSQRRNVEKILNSPKRYLIDKMILENLNTSQISEYCKKNLNLPIHHADVAGYKQIFFNLQTNNIEEKIKALEVEEKSLKLFLNDLDNLKAYTDIEIGEKVTLKKQAEQRIGELQDNIKTMNMMFSDIAFKLAVDEKQDFEQMFTEVLGRSYVRFCQLDSFKDRDVVDSLLKVAKIMTNAHDKVSAIKNDPTHADKGSQQVLLDLYKKRADEIASEQINKANKELEAAGIELLDSNLDPNDILGIEDLGMSFDVNEEEEED